MSRIMLVEDHEFFAKNLMEYLEGHEVVWCRTYAGALDCLHGTEVIERSFDVLVSDYDLGFLSPGVTGLDLLATPEATEVPRRILFSGSPPRDVPEDIEVFRKSHIVEFIEALRER